MGGVDAVGDEPGGEDVLEEVDGVDEVEEGEGGGLGYEGGALEPGEEEGVYRWVEDKRVSVNEHVEDERRRTKAGEEEEDGEGDYPEVVTPNHKAPVYLRRR